MPIYLLNSFSGIRDGSELRTCFSKAKTKLALGLLGYVEVTRVSALKV